MDYGNRNCYNYRRFRHLVRNCRNRGTENRIREGRRLEYGNRRMMEEGNRQEEDLNGDKVIIGLQCSLE